MNRILKALAHWASIAILTSTLGCSVVQPQKPTVEVVPVGVLVARFQVTPGTTNVLVQSTTNILGPWTTIYSTTNQPNRIDVIDHDSTGTKFYRLAYP